jgi:DNA-binding transcriptional LysR family regulator
MELQQIRYFIAISSHGSFSRAAQECGVSQPALTAAIKKLEAEIGGPLFHREGKRVVVTPMGRLVLPALQQALHGTQSAATLARNFQLLRQAPLRLGALHTVGPARLAAFLCTFHREHPGVEVTVQEGSVPGLLQMLEAGELDFAITNVAQPPPDAFRTEALYAEPYVVICPHGHRLSRLPRVRLADVDGEAYVDRLACELREAVMAIAAERRVRLYALFRGERDPWVQAMVRAGLGFAFMPLHSVDPDGVAVRPLVEPQVERTIALVDVRGRQRSRVAQLFADELRGFEWPLRPPI